MGTCGVSLEPALAYDNFSLHLRKEHSIATIEPERDAPASRFC